MESWPTVESLFSVGTAVDIVAVAIIFFFLIRGLARGASGEVARLAGLAGGICIGLAVHPLLYRVLPEAFVKALPGMARATAATLAILAGIVCFVALRFATEQMLQVIFQQPLDALCGMAAGAIYAAVLLTVLFTLGLAFPLEKVRHGFAEQSHVVRFLYPWLRSHLEQKP